MNADQTLIHPQALVDAGATIGARTRVWAFAHIVKDAIVGEDSNICDHTFIEGKVRIGNRVTIKCGVHLWDGVIVEDDVFIGPCAVFTNDLLPRSKRYPTSYLKTLLRRGCTIGANATILAGIEIGRWAMIGAGSVVTKSVPNHALVVGNPARLQAWVCECGQKLGRFKRGFTTCACGKRYRQTNARSIEEVKLES